MKLEDLEKLRPEIESWLRADGVSGDEEVTELAKTVIHRAWNNRDAYDPARPLAPWLRTIAKRIAIDHHRTITTRAALAYRLLEDERDNWTPERQYIYEELFRTLSDAIGTLDEKSRALIEAHYSNGRTLEQMSEDLGVPESTLNKRLIRARAAIRDYLEQRGITDAHRTLLPLALFRALYTYTYRSDGTPGGEESADSPQGPEAARPPAPPSTNHGRLADELPRESKTPDAEYGSAVHEDPRESTTPGAEHEEELRQPRRRAPSARPGRRWDRPAILVAGVLLGLILRAPSCARPHDRIEITLRVGSPVRLASVRAGCGIAAPCPIAPPTMPPAAPRAASRPASRPAEPEAASADRKAAQELLSGTVEPVGEPVDLGTPDRAR